MKNGVRSTRGRDFIYIERGGDRQYSLCNNKSLLFCEEHQQDPDGQHGGLQEGQGHWVLLSDHRHWLLGQGLRHLLLLQQPGLQRQAPVLRGGSGGDNPANNRKRDSSPKPAQKLGILTSPSRGSVPKFLVTEIAVNEIIPCHGFQNFPKTVQAGRH